MRSTADRLDEAVDQVLAGITPTIEPDLRALVKAATTVQAALPPMPAGARFEARLRSRLIADTRLARATDAVGAFTRRELRQPRHLIAAGAVSSAAVGVGLTALVVWRGTRRQAARGGSR
jgi:hypothetical protein